MLNETVFSLLNIGFNICFMLYLTFKYFYEQNNRYYLFLALLSLSFTINLTLRLEIVNGDYTWIRVSRKAVVLFFYAFIVSFLDTGGRRFVRTSLLSGMVFIGIGIISRLLISESSLFHSINTMYKYMYPIVDLFIISVMIFHVWNSRKGYYQYIFYGLLTVVICAILIYFGDNLLGIGRYISGFLIFQMEIVICFCFFFLAIITKENAQKAEIQRLHELVETERLAKEESLKLERERIAFDMHDELGAGLSAIKLQSEILKKQHGIGLNPEDLDNLIDIADHMNSSMREMLWSINPDNDNLGNFVGYCIGYGQEYFERTNIEFHHESNIQEPDSGLYSGIRHNLLMVVKEAFHNSAKHSGACLVKLSITADSRSIHLAIQDDGIGFPPNIVEGYGLRSIRKRVSRLDGKIIFCAMLPGTRIEITISTNI